MITLPDGVYDYLTKPLNMPLVVCRLRNALAHRLAEKEVIQLSDEVARAGRARSLYDVERLHILRILEECGNNQSRAAEILGIDRVTLHHKLKRYGWSRVRVTS
jgi:DNA-binding protein Fis